MTRIISVIRDICYFQHRIERIERIVITFAAWRILHPFNPSNPMFLIFFLLFINIGLNGLIGLFLFNNELHKLHEWLVLFVIFVVTCSFLHPFNPSNPMFFISQQKTQIFTKDLSNYFSCFSCFLLFIYTRCCYDSTSVEGGFWPPPGVEPPDAPGADGSSPASSFVHVVLAVATAACTSWLG